MKAVYTSDLHGEIHLYQELLVLVLSSSADLLVMGGDLFPSFPPTQRYEDMVPNQKTFIGPVPDPFLREDDENDGGPSGLADSWKLGSRLLLSLQQADERGRGFKPETFIVLRMDMR